MKKTKAFIAVAFTGALFLGGCATGASTTSDGSDAATVESTASQKAFAVEIPEPRGIEESSMILDSNLDALPPDTGLEVQADLVELFEAVQSFPDLQKGGQPLRPEDSKTIEPVIKPLMSEVGWEALANIMKTTQAPRWLPVGGLFDRIDYGEGETPLDESHRSEWTPDENGYTLVHSSTQPITLSTWFFDDGRVGVRADDVEYAWFFRNVEGELMYASFAEDLVFLPDADGGWGLAYWDSADAGRGSEGRIDTQADLDQLLSEF